MASTPSLHGSLPLKQYCKLHLNTVHIQSKSSTSLGLSPAWFRIASDLWYGVSPKHYSRANKGKKWRETLGASSHASDTCRACAALLARVNNIISNCNLNMAHAWHNYTVRLQLLVDPSHFQISDLVKCGRPTIRSIQYSPWAAQPRNKICVRLQGGR